MAPDPETRTRAVSPLRRLILGLLLGMLGLLLGMLIVNVMAFRLGIVPTSVVTRTGTATVTSCSLTWTTLYECRATVSWTGVAYGPSQDASPERLVVSSSRLVGTVAVTGRVYQPLSSAKPGELVLPVDQPSGRPGAWLLIGLAASIALCVLGFRLGSRLSRLGAGSPAPAR